MPSSPEAPDNVSTRQAVLADIIGTRRMTRSFLDQPVHDDAVSVLCHSALRGPSAGNTSAVEVLCLRSDRIDRYWETTLTPQRRAAFPWPGLLIAPVLLLLYVRPNAYVERYREPDKARTGLGEGADSWHVPYWWVDGGAAAQNVLLTAESCGLGACFFGQFDHEQAVRETFGVPEDRRAVGTIAFGYRDLASDRPSRSSKRPRTPAAARVHHGAWSEGEMS